MHAEEASNSQRPAAKSDVVMIAQGAAFTLVSIDGEAAKELLRPRVPFVRDREKITSAAGSAQRRLQATSLPVR